MTNDTILRVGLFGAGRIGDVHAPNIAHHPGVEFAWVCDPDLDRAEALATRFGARATTDADEVFASVDAVLIGAPNNAHVPLLAAAAAAGVPALCEKPIDVDMARVREFISSRGADAPDVQIAFNRRYDPAFAAIKQRVNAGEVGTVEQVTIISRDSIPAPAEYIRTSGGIFHDLSIHDLDLARFFVPDIVEVTAAGSNLFADWIEAEGDFDSAVIVLRGSRGEQVTIINSRRCVFGYDQRLEVFGSDGMLTAANVTPTTVTSANAEGIGQRETALPFFPERYADAYRLEFRAFIDAITSQTPCTPSVYDGEAALALADACVVSASTGTTIRLERAAALT